VLFRAAFPVVPQLSNDYVFGRRRICTKPSPNLSERERDHLQDRPNYRGLLATSTSFKGLWVAIR
jgi:hypothetical protein